MLHVFFSRRALVPVLMGLPLFACDCDPDVIDRLAPQIFVDACGTPQREVSGKLVGGFEDCALPFGESDISVRTSRTFTITNPSRLQLDLAIELEGDPNFTFVEAPPTFINPGLSAQVAIQIRPNTESTINAEVVIRSNANNTAQLPASEAPLRSEIRIPVTLTGVDNGVPRLVVTPGECDFGRVAVGGVKVCPITIRNEGTRALFFDELDFVPVGEGDLFVRPAGSDPFIPAFTLTGARPSPDTALGAGAEVSLRTTFAPDVEGRFEARIRIASNDPLRPELDIPLVGLGVPAPNCVAKVKSVNGVPVVGAPVIEPLDDVVITLEDSTPSSPGGTITGFRWEILERASGSTVVLSNPTGAESQFLFANRRGIDVAGRFVLLGSVTDDLGTDSINQCILEFEAIPSESFLVQLTWATPTGDMDIHVTKREATGSRRYCVQSLGAGGGSVQAPLSECSNNLDCYFGNCRATSSGFPEWDGVPGRTAGDPVLDIDDLSGFGPENINVDNITTGSYAFGGTYFSGSVPAPMTMRLFIFGRLAAEWVETVERQFWGPGIVHFDDRDPFNPCIEDLTDGDANDDCPGYNN
jgi:hypothetical protein